VTKVTNTILSFCSEIISCYQSGIIETTKLKNLEHNLLQVSMDIQGALYSNSFN